MDYIEAKRAHVWLRTWRS